MEDIQIRKDIDNINVNIETPHDDSNSNLHSLERDNWGKILNNKTFKLIKDNFVSIKSSLSNLLSIVVNEFNTINTKNNEIENDVNLIKKSVEDIKNNGSKINEETVNKFADKTKENIFNELNTFEKGINSKLININNNRFVELQEDTINIGNIDKNINIISKSNKLLFNGREIESGESINSGGNNKEYMLVKTFPEKFLKFNSKNKPYFKKESDSTELDSYYSQINHLFTINKADNPFTGLNVETNTLATDIIKVNLSNEGYYMSDSLWRIQSNSIIREFQSIFNIKSHTEKITISDLVGISFKFNISIEVVDRNAPKNKYSVIETLLNKEYFKSFDIICENKYGYVYLSDFNIKDVFNNPVEGKGIKNIPKFTLSESSILAGGSFIIIEFERETSERIKNYYNDVNKKFYIKLTFKEFNLIKYLENGKGGNSSSNNVFDFSGAYGTDIIAYTPSKTELPIFSLRKNNLNNIIEYNSNRLDDLFNGILPLEVDNVDILNNKDTKPIIFKYYAEDTNKNLIIPASYNNFENKGTLPNIFNNEKNNIPFDKIFGVSFKLYLNIDRVNNDRSMKTIINKYIDVEIRFKKGKATNLENLFESSDNNMDYYVNGKKESEAYTGWFKIDSIDLDNNKAISQDDMLIYLKLKRTGFYNLVKIKNYKNGNAIENVKCFESIRIENARPFFEDLNNLSTFRFDVKILDTKILLKI